MMLEKYPACIAKNYPPFLYDQYLIRRASKLSCTFDYRCQKDRSWELKKAFGESLLEVQEEETSTNEAPPCVPLLCRVPKVLASASHAGSGAPMLRMTFQWGGKFHLSGMFF